MNRCLSKNTSEYFHFIKINFENLITSCVIHQKTTYNAIDFVILKVHFLNDKVQLIAINFQLCTKLFILHEPQQNFSDDTNKNSSIFELNKILKFFHFNSQNILNILKISIQTNIKCLPNKVGYRTMRKFLQSLHFQLNEYNAKKFPHERQFE